MVVQTRSSSEPDRLSELPESLIVRILSLLEMKDAVKTGILSKSWKNLWKQVDSLVYICHDTAPYREDLKREEFDALYGDLIDNRCRQFTSFVDKTFRECTREKFKKFCFSENLGVRFLSNREVFDFGRIDAWIKYVLEKNVEYLKLEFEPHSPIYTAPDCVFQSSSLKKLELENVILTVTSPVVNMTSLQELFLRRVSLDDALMDNILMGCPMLETMHLDCVGGLHSINIRSRSMIKLELVQFIPAEIDRWKRALVKWATNRYAVGDDDDDDDDTVLQIIAPSLRELVILDKFLVDQVKLVDVSSLVKATLKFYNVFEVRCDHWIDITTEILKSVSAVDELILGSQLIQILTLLKLMKKPSPLFNCKHLAIELYFWNFELPGIAYLLENAPHLETLSIDVLGSRQHDVLHLLWYEYDLDDGDTVLEIISPSLRELVILDEFLVDKVKLVDVSSLVKATLKFHNTLNYYNMSLRILDNHLWIDMTTEILKSVSVVDELILGSQLIQILTLSKQMKKPSPLFNCKHLAIESYFWKFDLPGIAYLLENAPHLETLSIDVLDWQQAENPSHQICELFLNKDPHLNMPAGNFPNLMQVTIDFFRCSGNDEHGRGNEEYIECFDFDMLEYILKSAVVLEKLVLCSSRSRCEDASRCQLQDNCSFQSVPRLSSQLQATLMFQNRAGEWELKKKTNKYEFSFSK